MAERIVELKNAFFVYPKGGFSLKCDEFSLNRGQTIVVRGKNGSGKTTLSLLLCGVLRPARGELIILNKHASALSLGEIGKSVGYLFQEPSRQLFAATVWEEMTFLGELLGEDQGETFRKARNLLEKFGLLEHERRSVYRLSRGEKQRLAICSLLMRSPSAIILDEPTAGLDKKARLILTQTLNRLKDEGIALVIISHDRLEGLECDLERHAEGGVIL